MPDTTTKKAPKVRTVHRCTDCGASTAVWAGRCPGCDQWNTLVEEREGPPSPPVSLRLRQAARPISEITGDDVAPAATAVDELDRVLAGGLVPGSVTLVGGEPGIGKST